MSDGRGWLRSFPKPLPLRGLLLVIASIVILDILLVYGSTFGSLAHSDAACTILIAGRSLASHSPIAGGWYWPNGDVWAFAPHLLAIPLVALLGESFLALRMTEVAGLVLQIVALGVAFRQISRSTWLATLGALAGFVVVSRIQLYFAYVELSYGFVASVYALIFTLLPSFVASGTTATPRQRVFVGAALLFALSLQNPLRMFLFGVAPLLGVVAWPWRGVSVRSRLGLAALALGSWSLSVMVYRWLFVPTLSFSPHPGQLEFAVQDFHGILSNLRMFGAGLLELAGEPMARFGGGPDDPAKGFHWLAAPGLVAVCGAVVIVASHGLASREPTRTRLLEVTVLTQLAILLAPLLVGNLLGGTLSMRYLLPPLIVSTGIAIVLVARRGTRRTWWGRLGCAWAVSFAVAGLIGLFRITEEARSRKTSSHVQLGEELKRRRLTHGFATYWNANIVTVLSGGASTVCPVLMADGWIMPQKFNSSVSCFERGSLPGRIFLAATPAERDAVERAIAWGFPSPIERFSVGDSFEVSVFDISGAPLRWLDLPIPIPRRLQFPVRFSATHMGLSRANATVDSELLVATGREGPILYGPNVPFPRGRYRVRWIGAGLESPGELRFDVSFRDTLLAPERRVLASTAGSPREELVAIDFTLPEERPVEFRAFSIGGARVVLRSLEIERLGDP